MSLPPESTKTRAAKPLKAYIEAAEKYIDAAGQLAGKPQKLTVVGEHLYWTQGRTQELFRVSTTDVSATGERAIVTEEELAAREAATVTVAGGVSEKPPPSVREAMAEEAASDTPDAPHPTTATTADATTETAAAAGAPAEKKLTKEEELLRERMRSLVTGISSYHVRPSDNAIFFISGLDLFVYYQEGPLAHKKPVKVFDFLSEEDQKHFADKGGKPHMYIQFASRTPTEEDASPIDFSRLTFVNNNNVYLAELHEDAANADALFTIAITPITTIGDDQHQCGVAGYIVQEEFDRYTGHYANARYVVFSYTDMSMMRHVALLKGSGEEEGDDDGTERMAYSRVGDPNARTTIVVYDTERKSYAHVPQAALVAAAQASSAAFSNVEYIPRFGFKRHDTLYLSLLSRTQEEAAVVSCPIDELPAITEQALQHIYDKESQEEEGGGHAKSESGNPSVNMKVEWAQRIPWAWVDVMPGAPILFGKVYDVMVRAADETEAAHYHIYYRAADHGADAWRPVTSGNWSVRAGTVCVHEGETMLSFIANVDGRLKYTLYSVTMPSAKFADAATAPVTDDTYLIRHSGLNEHVYGGSVCHDRDSVYFVASSKHQPAQIVCAKVDHHQGLHTVPAEPWLRPPKKQGQQQHDGDNSASFVLAKDRKSFQLFGCPMVVPSLVTVRNRRGVPLSAHLFPAAAEAEKASSGGKRPLALFVYGGPHVQLVTENDFDANCRATVQALAHHGMHVAIVDNQQATCNSLRELAICKKNMGSFETEDYCDVVSFLTGKATDTSSDALPDGWDVDADRVAIFGWSYGGYATLLAMSQAADVFKIGFAGAPVGDWKLYDTGYTERYMGLLHETEAAAEAEEGRGAADASRKISEQYNSTTIGSFVEGFPDDLNRVFIAHGLLDENVHFLHTAHVVEAMVAAGKPYTVLVYPGERHGLRQKKASRLHHEGTLIKTLVELL